MTAASRRARQKICGAGGSPHQCIFPEERREDEGGEENDEEPMKTASREKGPPAPGGRNEGFLAGSVFDASMPPWNSAGQGNGDDLLRSGEGS